jgi:uncharacterized protein RhaS with RHS repeats
LHARYYGAPTARFLSIDPSIDLKKAVANPQMWNRYAYVSNNPISAIDPDGRAETRIDNQLYRDQLAVVSGQMTMDQYNEDNAARANGAMIRISYYRWRYCGTGSICRWSHSVSRLPDLSGNRGC